MGNNLTEDCIYYALTNLEEQHIEVSIVKQNIWLLKEQDINIYIWERRGWI